MAVIGELLLKQTQERARLISIVLDGNVRAAIYKGPGEYCALSQDRVNEIARILSYFAQLKTKEGGR